MVQSFQWIFFVLFSFLFCETFANYDTLGWTSQQGTSGADFGWGVAVSCDGFIYVTGDTSGSLNGQPYLGKRHCYYHLNYAILIITQVVPVIST